MTMTEIFLSICIPTYNRAAKLGNMLDFLLADFKNYYDKIEILVSDNASTDYTRELLKKKQNGKNKFIYWTNDKNLGVIGNLIKLAQVAKGEYIWFIGDDDILLPGIADEIFEVFENHNKIDGLLLNHSTIRGEIKNVSEKSLVPISGGFYENGQKAVLDIVKKGRYGAIMFITANILRRNTVLEVIEYGNCSNLALPLLWSMANHKKDLFVVRKNYLYDQCEGTSWADYAFLVHIENVTDVFCCLEKFGYSKQEVQTCLKARLNTENSLTLLLFKYFLKNPIKGISIYRKYGFINIILRTPKQLIEYLKRKLSKGK